MSIKSIVTPDNIDTEFLSHFEIKTVAKLNKTNSISLMSRT